MLEVAYNDGEEVSVLRSCQLEFPLSYLRLDITSHLVISAELWYLISCQNGSSNSKGRYGHDSFQGSWDRKGVLDVV